MCRQSHRRIYVINNPQSSLAHIGALNKQSFSDGYQFKQDKGGQLINDNGNTVGTVDTRKMSHLTSFFKVKIGRDTTKLVLKKN